ncbi:nicotinate-nucleotide--dimethylbenzimidazole phosphoribosyltransferase [Sphingosinicella sp. BN140058]|uniref:nicotinate-nucleotide--dimethylbenzimidazole phosphoribosyltransferase n=1 Tax=Sphingosinicella sp. BN140058 TaxID=1892855 RepID=UPI0010132BE8|nr:nicotinate-nucleotide--dimethylbenzimidazole phosphoribosyltransferase [Sphingosinicella sp. BN140058]QAY77519.1 nicotinate-nucleotide--dimethylbenzimidazole phosphoribosyltransferase [Sphingosinicella sp. BN140058]
MIRFRTIEDFEAALADLPAPDGQSVAAAGARQASLTKPAGSLGRLEDIALFFAGWQRCIRPVLARGRATIFAGNHGVAARGVSAFPAEVTAQMVANFQRGGAAINALAAAAGLELKIVALELDRPTADFTQAPAMTAEDCLQALQAGADAVEGEIDLLVVGEMGIANSTAAAALSCASFGGAAEDWTGRGTGIDDEALSRKIEVVEAGVSLHGPHAKTPFEMLRRLAGREIAAIAGAVLAARRRRIPVMLDGFIACSALAPLARDVPQISAHCLAGHVSAEPGHKRLLAALALAPLLDLDMRLGEGSGAAVAVGLVRAALAAHAGMATFEEARVATAS